MSGLRCVCPDGCFAMLVVGAQRAQETHSTMSVSGGHYHDDSPVLISNANKSPVLKRRLDAEPARGIGQLSGCLGPRRHQGPALIRSYCSIGIRDSTTNISSHDAFSPGGTLDWAPFQSLG
ncbi:Hypothetical protein SMAX5B_002788 [Scophthalmus maximus]|uniref:Uncharacterized protein n=1 Tax=Scophthalmus maximus TaxID=52904 RepID=A0A2U9BET0_SCOMX|nr:Hypothetical protein SMAX5B_002788 [Scophthalmus maximus]